MQVSSGRAGEKETRGDLRVNRLLRGQLRRVEALTLRLQYLMLLLLLHWMSALVRNLVLGRQRDLLLLLLRLVLQGNRARTKNLALHLLRRRMRHHILVLVRILLVRGHLAHLLVTLAVQMLLAALVQMLLLL